MRIKIITVDGSTLQQRVTRLLKQLERESCLAAPSHIHDEATLAVYVKDTVASILNRSIVDIKTEVD